MKVLNFLLAAAMVSSAVVMPVHNETASAAGNVEEIIYQTDFDDISSLSDLTGDAGSKTGWGYYYAGIGDQYGFDGSQYIDIINEDGNKYLYTYQTASQGGKENALYYDTSAITSGSIVSDYDIKFDVENLVNMRIGYGLRADTMVTEKGEVYNGYWRSGADKISLAQPEAISADKWYHVTLTADFDSDTMGVLIVDRDTQAEIVNEQLTGLSDKSVTRALGINIINYTGGGSEKQGAYIDNLTITHVSESAVTPESTPEPTPVAPGGPAELPMNETFDYNNIADMEAAGWFWRGDGNNISKIEDGVFNLGLQAGKDNYEAKRKIEPVTSGILTEEYDVTPAQGVIAYNYFWGTDSGTLKALFFNTDNKIYFNGNPGSTVIGTYTPGQTYHCKVVVDIDNDTLDITVTDSENQVVGAKSGSCAVSRIEEITFQTWAAPAQDTWVAFDNLTVELGDEPIVTPEPTPVTPGGPAELPMNETFDYGDIDEMTAAGWTWDGVGDNISKIENGVFNLGLQAGKDNYQAKRNIEEVTSGRLNIEYDVTPVAGLCAYVWTGTSRTPVFFFSGGSIRIGSTTSSDAIIGSYTDGETYHCSATLDLDNSTLTAKVTKGDDTIAQGSASGINRSVSQIVLQTWASPASDSWVAFDNLTVAVEETPVVTPDPTFEEVIYENDFDDVEKLNDLDGKVGDGWNRDIGGRTNGLGNDGAIMLLEEGANKYLYVNHTTDTFELGDTVSMSYDYPSVTSGQVIYDFDIMTDRANMTFMRFGYSAHMDNSIMANGELYNSYWTADKLKLTNNTIEANKWYHAVITADLTSDFSTVYIEDKETGKVVVDVDIPIIGNHNLTRFSIDCTDPAKENIGGAYLDNLKITKTNKPATDPRPMPEPEFKFDENFDSYADLDAMKANGWSISNGYSSTKPGPNSEDSVLVGEGTDKSFYLGIDNNTDNIQAIKSFDTSISQGKARLEFDIIPSGDTLTYIWMSGTGEGAASGAWSANRISLFVFNNGQAGIGGNDISRCKVVGNYMPGQKYHCSIVIDIENDTLTAEIENEDGSLVGSETLGYKGHAGTDIFSLTGLTLQEWGAATNTGSTFDNIVVERLPEDAPTVSISQVTFVTDGEESNNYRAVSTLTDSIAINFGAVMDPETLTGIKLVNSADGSEAKFTSEVNGNIVNLNLTNTLAANAEYSIVIPAEAANIDGTALGEDETIVFNTTDDAVYEGAIKALTAGGTAVTGISQIKTGTALAADVKLNNATEESKNAVVIFSFYDADGRLTGTNYEVIKLDAGAKYENTVEYTVGDMTDVASAKVMLWDGFESMVALDGCVTIK